jgi:hypothetical protein
MSTQGLSGGSFNFDTQAGVAHVLASVRAANITAEQKNDLRDTIFLYINGGRDQTVKLALEQKLATYAIVPAGVAPATTSSAPTPPTETTSTIGRSRSGPSDFSVSTQPVSAPASPTISTIPIGPVTCEKSALPDTD